MKNKMIIIAIVAVIVATIALVSFLNRKSDNLEGGYTTNMNIVTSLEDRITNNTAWCGTFNLIWNDLKNEIAMQDIIFDERIESLNNLNKGTFTIDDISENSYYKTFGITTPELKKEIEKALKNKFNETSSILDDFDFENAGDKDYFLYSMLKKEFEFPKVFTKLENGTFGESDVYENVKYFGLHSDAKSNLRKQVEVLYYYGEEDFAVKLKTKGNDEVILAVGTEGESFLDIYEYVMDSNEEYDGSHSFGENDTLKVPCINFNLKEEFSDLENKEFSLASGEKYIISKALQTIEFELNEKGGKIKSEAGMGIKEMAAFIEDEPRYFDVDKEFTIFLIEEEKELPYFAAYISDITAVQNEATYIGESTNDSNDNNN